MPALTVVPYLTADEARARASSGGPTIGATEFVVDGDDLVEEWITEAEELVEDECRVAFTPRETVETVQVSAPGGLHRLVLKWPKVRSIESITVDGTALAASGYELDADAGILTFTSCPSNGQSVVVTYRHGFDAPPKALLRATGIFVERMAAAQRSGSTRDVKVGLSDNGSVVYIRPVPGTWQITGWDDFDSIVARLPHYNTPGLA